LEAQRTLFRPKYGTLGWVALPNIFLFQILLPLISPIIDLLFSGAVAIWALEKWRFSVDSATPFDDRTIYAFCVVFSWASC